MTDDRTTRQPFSEVDGPPFDRSGCPNTPPCVHSGASHGIVTVGDPMPVCYSPGCRCGRP